MPIVRTLSNGNKVTDWTQEVKEIDNQYGLLNGMGLFNEVGTSQESVIFEKEYQTSTLIPQTSRRGKPHSKGQDRQAEVFSLALPYFSTSDYITPSDIQGKRKVGTPDGAQDLASAIAVKMEDMRVNIDQTKEFMKICAIRGITVDPQFHRIADMFDEFGLTAADYTINWTLSDPAFDVDEAIRNLKRAVAKNAKTGGRIGNVHMLVTPEFFDALIKHPKIREAYLHYSVTGASSDVIRGNLQTFESWGVVDHFVHQGFTFMSYDADFNFPDGTVQRGFGEAGRTSIRGTETTAMGIVLVDGVRDLYRAYYGPSNTLSGANKVGAPLFMYQWTDPKDKFIEMEAEMSPLYVLMKPQLAMEVHAV